ncbi:MAG: hypothetical protein ABIN89_24795 [Chitinophagaceae bacterium]
MKKLSLSLLLILAVCAASQAQLKFYFYPATNVYYDVAQTRYIYLDNGNWTPVKVLPARFKGMNGPKYIVYNKTPDVWIVNDVHVKKYKAQKQKNYPPGQVVRQQGNSHKAVKIKVKH